MPQVKFYFLLLVLGATIFHSNGFSQVDSNGITRIAMTETAKPLNYELEELHGTWKLDLYVYPERSKKDTSYFFLLLANQSSLTANSALLNNAVPCLMVKKEGITYFILNSKKDFNFLDNNKENKIVYPNDTVQLKLNDKSYNFSLTIGDTVQFTNRPTRSFPNLDTVFNYKKEVNHIFLSVQFLNRKTGSFIIDNKQFWLTAIDGNFNGVYNDNMLDKVGIRSKKEADIFDAGFVGYNELINFQLNDTTKINFNRIENNGTVYTAEKLHFLNIFPQKENDFFKQLRIVDTIPDFVVPLFDGKQKDLKKLFEGKEYLLIYQWGLWCSGCYTETDYLLKNYTALSKYMNIVGFNYKDGDLTKVRNYIEKEKIPWTMARSNATIFQNIFKRMGFPAAILIRKDLSVQKYFTMPYYLNSFIKGEEPNSITK